MATKKLSQRKTANKMSKREMWREGFRLHQDILAAEREYVAWWDSIPQSYRDELLSDD
jgi:hypothetical protein